MQLAIEFRQPFGGADVGPASVVQFSAHLAARNGGVEQQAQFERVFGQTPAKKAGWKSPIPA